MVKSKEMFSKIPKLQELKGIILNLQKQKDNGSDYSSIMENLNSLLYCTYPVSGYHLSKKQIFLRGVVYPDKYELPCNISSLLNKFHRNVKNYGRCNLPRQSVLYAADSLPTILCEINLKKNDLLFITKFSMPEGIEIASIGDLQHVYRYNIPFLPDPEMQQIYSRILSGNFYQTIGHKMLFVDSFLADEFRKADDHPNKYLLTSAISNFIFMTKKAGFVYPSVKPYGGRNFVFTERAARFVMPLQCHALYVKEEIGYGIYNLQQVAQSSSIADDGTIEWIECTENDVIISRSSHAYRYFHIQKNFTDPRIVSKNPTISNSKFWHDLHESDEDNP